MTFLNQLDRYTISQTIQLEIDMSMLQWRWTRNASGLRRRRRRTQKTLTDNLQVSVRRKKNSFVEFSKEEEAFKKRAGPRGGVERGHAPKNPSLVTCWTTGEIIETNFDTHTHTGTGAIEFFSDRSVDK